MNRKSITAILLLAGTTTVAFADDSSMDQRIADIAHRWAAVSYTTPEAQKDAAFADVIANAQSLSQAFPGNAEPLIWQAIALASAAKVEGGLGALHKAKEARDLLLAAETIKPTALDGSIYCSLGSLYGKVPGWPIGFGDRNKARGYLEKALAIDSTGIDANYFYADFLADQGEYAESVLYLKRALAAPARPGREDADTGRRRDVASLLEMLKRKHGDELATK